VLGVGDAPPGEPFYLPDPVAERLLVDVQRAGGLTSRELLRVLRGLTGLNLVSGDVVEVSPPYDHAEITALAAATVVYDLLTLMARASTPG
jgi:arginase family enzyme